MRDSESGTGQTSTVRLGTDVGHLLGMFYDAPGASRNARNATPSANASCITTSGSCGEMDLAISGVILTVGLVAFLENLALVVATHRWKLGKSCRMFWFLWHMSLADALVAFTFAYFHLRVVASCSTPHSSVQISHAHSCTPGHQAESIVLVILFFSAILASHLFVLAATIDRFIAIRWSLRYLQLVTTRSARVVTAIVWTISFVIPFLGAMGVLFLDPGLYYSITTVVCASACLLSAVLVVVLNAWMVRYAWASIRNAPARTSVSRVSRMSTTSSFPDLSSIQSGIKPTVTLALFVVSFIISCAPWSVALIVCEEAHSCVLKKNQDYTLVLVLLHAVVIPILYGFRVEEVKKHVIGFWKNLLPACHSPSTSCCKRDSPCFCCNS